MRVSRLSWSGALCLFWLLCAGVGGVAAQEPPRSIWLWSQHGFPMLDSPALSTASLNFLKQKDIQTIYLYADLDSFHKKSIIADEPEKYRSFIAGAHSRGMKVFALFGDDGRDTEGWILPERQGEAVTAFQNMFDYNKNSQPNERFDGANMDVEPYLLGDWDSALTERAPQYLDLSATFMAMKHQYLNDIGETDASQFPVGPATPFWFDRTDYPDIAWSEDSVSQPVSKRLYQHVLDIYDYISILDYRDFALTRDDRGDGVAAGRTDGIINLAASELSYANTIGKPVYIGVETIPISLPYVSFYEDGPDRMETELAIALEAFQQNWPDAFEGFVLHDFIWYQRLINEGPFIHGIPVPEPAAGLLLAGAIVTLAGRPRRPRGD